MVPFGTALLSYALGQMGKVKEGLVTIEEGFAQMERTGERVHEAELRRIKGDLLLKHDRADYAVAEASFREAIEVARRQKAKSWELRSASSLARLLRDLGRHEEARNCLTPIYGWFTEGFDTPDLKDAKALLDELS